MVFCSSIIRAMAEFTLSSISRKLTEDVIDKYFKVKTNSNDKAESSIVVSRAAAAGEGLIGAVYRIKVKGFKNEASFVAKGLVPDPLLKKTLRSDVYFEREIFFFSNVLPLYVEVQKTTGAKERIQNNIPKCYTYYVGNDDDFILMEDLSDCGCSSISKLPTVFERDMILKALAHMHAVSFALKIKQPKKFDEIVSNLPEIYYNSKNRDWYAQFLKNAIDINVKVLTEYEDPYSIYYKKFINLTINVYDQLIDLSSYKGDKPVLNHGDAWLSNFLCSKDKAVAIDFQLFRCTSLVTDLTYVLTLSSNLTNNKHDYINSIRTYYGYLEYYLNDMGLNAAEVYSWNTFDKELKRYGKFGLLASMTSFAFCHLVKNSKRCDVLLSIAENFVDIERIPLEELWILRPIKEHKQKMVLVNAVRIAVDVGLI